MIWKLAVHPAHQSLGIGLRLLDRLIAEAAGKAVRLSYVEGNEQAAGFYRAYGFVPVDRTRPERPGWPGEVVMEWRTARPL